MEYATKLLYQSNYWYNDGLRKANIRDLTGAMASLKKSLQYNRDNIAARNLLGLVYYGRGEVAEALMEWILSKNFQPRENIANYYIQKVRENQSELEEINQAVKRYNQALLYCQQNGEDLAIIQLKKAVAAHPTFVKAYQLLTLLYIDTAQYSQARQAIRTAHKLDTTDAITLRYMHELTQIRKKRNVKIKQAESKEQHTVTYNVGNETIIQPVSSSYKDHAGLHSVVNIGIGLIVGVAVMWFLIMPAITSSRQSENNQQTLEFSDQIATQNAQISALKKELENYRSTSEETEDAQATASATKDSYEIVMNIATHIYAGDMSDSAMLEEILKVNVNALGTLGREQYDEITENLFPQMCETLYAEAQECFEAGNYDTAIEDLEQVTEMDEGYEDGEALLLLGRAYAGKGDSDQASVTYQKVLESYKDTDAAGKAQKLLNGESVDTEDTSADSDTYSDDSPGDYTDDGYTDDYYGDYTE
jgi:tetratricopeptide (TPR) repeat protein